MAYGNNNREHKESRESSKVAQGYTARSFNIGISVYSVARVRIATFGVLGQSARPGISSRSDRNRERRSLRRLRSRKLCALRLSVSSQSEDWGLEEWQKEWSFEGEEQDGEEEEEEEEGGDDDGEEEEAGEQAPRSGDADRTPADFRPGVALPVGQVVVRVLVRLGLVPDPLPGRLHRRRQRVRGGGGVVVLLLVDGDVEALHAEVQGVRPHRDGHRFASVAQSTRFTLQLLLVLLLLLLVLHRHHVDLFFVFIFVIFII
ncbi:hypothetical protein EYF80_049338 [Liparis tanakae]|uniref:Uncharacterized protein n=1 Tax=Liparis tanakae TaxID=230148 RepID=A0A4Z2FHU5_9TELE|nr:hypothetical protein EYF80_049338 [Liparis tanakae]